MINARVICHSCFRIYDVPVPIQSDGSEGKFYCDNDKSLLITFITPCKHIGQDLTEGLKSKE